MLIPGWKAIFVFGMLSALAGCGGLGPVEGTVTLDGKPLGNAMIAFVPMDTKGDNNAPRPAQDLTDENGFFQLKTIEATGVVPGRYKIIVSKIMPPTGSPNKPTEADIVNQSVRRLDGVELVPRRYTRSEETPLEVTIPEEGKTDLLFELQSRQTPN